MIVVCSLADLNVVCDSVKPSHLISIASNSLLKRGNNRYKRGKRAKNTNIVQSNTFKINTNEKNNSYINFILLFSIFDHG